MFFARYGNVMGMIGAVLAFVIEVVEVFDSELSLLSATFGTLRIISALLLIAGVWYLHLAQSQEAGRLSLIGVVVMTAMYIATIALMYSFIGGEMPNVDDPAAAALELGVNSALIFVVLALSILGPLLFGIAVARTKIFPRWMGITLAVAPFIGFVTAAGGPTIILNISEVLSPLMVGLLCVTKLEHSV